MPRKAAETISNAEAEQAPLPGPTGLEGTLSPVDLPPAGVPLPHPLRWATTVIVVAAGVLTLLNARAIRSWSYQLDPNDATARVVTAAEAWYAAVDRPGLNLPVAAMHDWWEKARGMRFPGVPGPTDPTAEDDPAQR